MIQTLDDRINVCVAKQEIVAIKWNKTEQLFRGSNPQSWLDHGRHPIQPCAADTILIWKTQVLCAKNWNYIETLWHVFVFMEG